MFGCDKKESANEVHELRRPRQTGLPEMNNGLIVTMEEDSFAMP